MDILYNNKLYNIEKKDFLNMMQIFNLALLDIGYKQEKIINYYLPNTWFITQNGNLCNTRSSNHAGADLSEYYMEFKEKILNGKFEIKKNIDNANKINPIPEYNDPSCFYKNGYVRFDILDLLLHYIDYIKFNYKIFEPKYLKIITGMIETEKDLYNFLEKLYKYTNDPIQELNKITELTKDNYDDVLIRCCGASKVISKLKIIVTSHLNYEYKFKEYINKGWDIRFIPPIIINKEKGIVEEDSADFVKIKTFRKQY